MWKRKTKEWGEEEGGQQAGRGKSKRKTDLL